MTKTSSNRCSDRLVVCLLVASALAAMATPGAAISGTAEEVPEASTVGSQVTATVTLSELYRNPSLEQWQLTGETALTDVTWTLVYLDQTGAKVGQESFDGRTFDGATIDASEDVAEVEVRIRGTVPSFEQYSYEPRQTFELMRLAQTRQGGSTTDIGTWTVNYFTAASEAARTDLNEARAAIERASAAGADTAAAERTFANAVDAYENGNFELAVTLAEEARSAAGSAQQSNQLSQLAVYAAGGLALVGVVVGGVLYWRSQQETYDRLG
jgi:hypothetical protein